MKSAILCAQGIGDALLMMIAYHALEKAGHDVTLFHDKREALLSLFPTARIQSYPDTLSSFQDEDLLIIQNDNSARCWEIMRHRTDFKRALFLYPTPCKGAAEGDFLFDPHLPVATNIAKACAQLLCQSLNKSNGLEAPVGAHYQKFKKRIAIHPTSADVKRNWLPQQFVSLALKIKKRGFDVAFTVSRDEYPYWEFAKEHGIEVPELRNLQESARYLYESGFFIGNDSGLGHLASNLAIPTLTISGSLKRVRLWRPDWAPSTIITPWFPLPNFKGIHLRLRENCWQPFVPEIAVLRKFLKSYDASSHCSR